MTKSIYRPSPDIPASRTGTIVFSGEEKPAQYVEYVESDGTIYVDTGVCGKSGTAAEVKMAFLEKSDCGFLDARAGGNRFYLLHNNTKDDNKMLYGYGGTAPAIGQAEVGTVYTVSSSLATGAQTISVDGTQRINATDAAAIDTGLNLYLFTCNWNGYPNWNGKARLYYLKLHQGNADGSNMQLVRNLEPVRLTNGLVVLWDFASKKPYAARSAKISEGTTIILR